MSQGGKAQKSVTGFYILTISVLHDSSVLLGGSGGLSK